MKLIIEAELDGATCPGVITDAGGRMVAVFAGRAPIAGEGLVIRPLDPVSVDVAQRIREAGFRLGGAAGDVMQMVWAGSI